jgi:hypothetical protein
MPDPETFTDDAGRYADQHAHNVTWMTAEERNAMSSPEPTVNPWEELNRLRKAARLALAYTTHARELLGAETVEEVSRMAGGANWHTLARANHISRPSEATIALAVELLASAAHPSATRHPEAPARLARPLAYEDRQPWGPHGPGPA